MLLRAVRECPAWKPLWIEGLAELKGVSIYICRTVFFSPHRSLNLPTSPSSRPPHAFPLSSPHLLLLLPLSFSPQVVPAREVSDLLDIASDKGLRLRTDVMEAMLQELGEKV